MSYPSGFFWGTATAAHQIEGNNVNSDWWELEHLPGGPCAEPSGDACDSYHRYAEDVAIVADLGLNAYRFSIEWARVEPEEGEFSRAQVEHYRRVIDTVRSAGLEPFVTLHHFTNPRWFVRRGGWRADDAADLFARYVERLTPLLDGLRHVCTINEPNIASALSRLSEPGTMQAAGLPDPDVAVSDGLSRAHRRAVEIVRATGADAGWSVATQAFHPLPGAEEVTVAYAYERETRFLEEARDDDWLGVQAYTRTFVGPEGPLPVVADTKTTQTGWEYWPPAAAWGLREAARRCPGVPLLVTENGIATSSDEDRLAYVRDALTGVRSVIAEGVEVRGYFYWSLLDNFEWASGYGPKFGLVSVDPETFERTVKPSARWLEDVR
ncbi:MAG TPA: family 1 glycosylhydrolase [Marmoricola sp.]